MVTPTTSRRGGARHAEPAAGSAAPGTAPPATEAGGREAPALRRSRAVVDALQRLDEFVVRFLDVPRCGVWTVSADGTRATCVDMYARDESRHRREDDREGGEIAAVHRHLQTNGIIVASAAHADAHLVPPGATAALAVALRQGNRLVAYLSAEQTGRSRPWTVHEQRFMKSMVDVMREAFAMHGGEGAAQADASLLDDLPLVAYRATTVQGQWTLTRVSHGAQRHLGRAASALIGRPLDDLRRLVSPSPPALPPEGEFEFGHVVAVHGGSARRFSEKGRVGVDPDTGDTVVQGYIADISASAGKVADSAAQLELLSHVSHELRTPLNAILGFAQLLQREATPDAAQRDEYLGQIQRAGQYMLEVIQEVTDHTRLQAAPVEVQIAPVSLAAVVADCLPLVASQAHASNVRVINAVRDPALRVAADARRLSQAVVNLLSNAIKYNRKGGSVFIECQAQERLLVLRITDTGMGLDAAQIAGLFQPFNRLGMERSEIEGVGLGLVITRRLLDAMDASIGVSSQPGAGSTFEVTLPRAGAG